MNFIIKQKSFQLNLNAVITFACFSRKRIFILICSTYTFGSEQGAALYFNHFETVNVTVNVMRIQYVFHYILQLAFETYFVLVNVNQ